MGEKLICQFDLGGMTGWPPAIIIEMNEHGGIDSVTVTGGSWQPHPAYKVRGEETEREGE